MARMVIDDRNKQKQGQVQPTDPTQPAGVFDPPGPTTITPPKVDVPELKPPTRITITKVLDAANHSDALAMISREIVQILFNAGEGVEVTIAITASNPDGFPEQTTRPAKGNSDLLDLKYEDR